MQKKKNANWYRIIGNAGIAFCTTLAGVSLVGVSAEQAWAAALVPAAIQAGLSFFKEMSIAGEELGKAFANMTLL